MRRSRRTSPNANRFLRIELATLFTDARPAISHCISAVAVVVIARRATPKQPLDVTLRSRVADNLLVNENRSSLFEETVLCRPDVDV